MKTTFQFNKRLEVRFDAIPSTQVRGELKSRGFWWDGRAQCWHLAKPVSLRFVRNEPISQDGFEYALAGLKTFCGMTEQQADEMRKAYDFARVQAAEQGMEEACGIR